MTFAKKMKIILLLLATMLTGFGGMRQGPHSYATTSRDGDYVFIMSPGPKGEEHAKGFGVCYHVLPGGELKEVWRTSGWWSQWIQLSWDGQDLARVGCWSSGDQDNVADGDSLALALYKEGRLLKQYRVSDLVKDVGKLESTTAGTCWWGLSDRGKPNFRSWMGDYFLRTADGFEYAFDLSSGDIKEAKKADPKKTTAGEQAGANQPATVPESKPEGRGKPQPEKEVAPR